MTAFQDVNGIQDALRSALASIAGNDADGNSVTISKAFCDADETDFDFANMPMLDVTVERQDAEVLAGQNYHVLLLLKVTILVADFTSYRNSCILRNNLLKSAQDAIRANAAFHGDIESSRLGTVTFAKVFDEEKGAFVAAAEMDVTCMGYRDR